MMMIAGAAKGGDGVHRRLEARQNVRGRLLMLRRVTASWRQGNRKILGLRSIIAKPRFIIAVGWVGSP